MKSLLIAAILFSPIASAYTEDEKAFIKAEWGVDVDQASQSLDAKESQNENERNVIAQELDDQYLDFSYLAERSDKTMKIWVNLAAILLTKRGHRADAEQIKADYERLYSVNFRDLYSFNFPYGGIDGVDPYSQWLEDVYTLVEAIVGEATMKLLHLDDIREVNYSIPVALQPRGDKRVSPVRKWTEAEYVPETSDHFAGPITFWSVYLLCTGWTYGTATAFACSPIGSASETIVASYIAPPICRRIYHRTNP